MAEKSKEPVITSPEDLMYEGTGQRTPTYDEILDALKFTMEMSPAGDVKNLYEGSKKMGTSPSIEALAQMGEGLVPLAMMATGPVGYGLTKGAIKGGKKLKNLMNKSEISNIIGDNTKKVINFDVLSDRDKLNAARLLSNNQQERIGDSIQNALLNNGSPLIDQNIADILASNKYALEIDRIPKMDSNFQMIPGSMESNIWLKRGDSESNVGLFQRIDEDTGEPFVEVYYRDAPIDTLDDMKEKIDEISKYSTNPERLPVISTGRTDYLYGDLSNNNDLGNILHHVFSENETAVENYNQILKLFKDTKDSFKNKKE